MVLREGMQEIALFIQKGRIRSMHCEGQIISKLEFV
jgi:hypothetical protein